MECITRSWSSGMAEAAGALVRMLAMAYGDENDE
jgi:hypothetical protein